FFKLPMKVENQCNIGSPSRHSGAFWVHTHYIKSPSANTETKIVILGIAAYALIPRRGIFFVNKLQLSPQQVFKFYFRNNFLFGKNRYKGLKFIIRKIIICYIFL